MRNPNPDDRDLYLQIVRNSARRLKPDQQETMVRLWFDPTWVESVSDMARQVGTTRQTIRKYTDLFKAADKHSAAQVLRTGNNLSPLTKDPDLPATNPQLQDGAWTDLSAALEREKARLTTEDIQGIIDRAIRRADEAGASLSQLKPGLELKIKFEDLTAVSGETLIDPFKVIGPKGLPGITASVRSRTATLAAHRLELPEIWKAVTEIILTAVVTDLRADPQNPPDHLTPLLDSLVEIRSSQEVYPSTGLPEEHPAPDPADAAQGELDGNAGRMMVADGTDPADAVEEVPRDAD